MSEHTSAVTIRGILAHKLRPDLADDHLSQVY